ncbi:CAP domain-containing protein [Metabacillus sp. 84]|uniref:CAP domain-containing protein n=1 Tax=unclassified Metabacillus TaxID=2675274 RepID=UPI003CFB07EC
MKNTTKKSFIISVAAAAGFATFGGGNPAGAQELSQQNVQAKVTELSKKFNISPEQVQQAAEGSGNQQQIQEQIQQLLGKQAQAAQGQNGKDKAQKPNCLPGQEPEAAKEQAPAPAKEQAPASAKEQAPAPAQGQQQAPAKEQASEPKQETAKSGALSEFEQQVVELTNQEREKQGLKPLQVDEELSKVAKEKSADMQKNNYFDHNSPTYGSPFDMMKQFGVEYKTAGENIAMGQKSPEEVVQAWMNSEGHRKNIMNSEFTHIGVGHVEEGNYWTQQFIGK